MTPWAGQRRVSARNDNFVNERTETGKMLSAGILRCAALGAALVASTAIAADNGGANKKKRLQIVFMFGQSEMVGQAKVSAASYMLQEPLVPPRDVTLNAHKEMLHQINGAYLYWQAVRSYAGPKEKQQQLKELIEERERFRVAFRQQVLDEMAKNGSFRGRQYRPGFALYDLVDLEAEAVGITGKIRAILDAPDNQFNVVTAYDQLIKNSNSRHQKQLALNDLFLKSTTSGDFANFAEADKMHDAEVKDAVTSPEDRRRAYAALAEKHLHMPIAKSTYIYGLGSIAGTPESDAGNTTHGKLSVGYGSDINTFGLEYATGITLEGMIDAPVLIVKCAWNDGRAGIGQLWRASSLDGVETPSEKLARDTWNNSMLESWSKKTTEEKQQAIDKWNDLTAEKKAVTQKPGTPKATPQKTGQPAWAWERILPRVKAILDAPGKFHPGYDAQAGYNLAGMIWFQGLSDTENPDYALHLGSMLTDFRTFVKSPDMPVVCATVGMMPFQSESDASLVNQGMREVANSPAFKGTVNVVETYKSFPTELETINSLFFKRKLTSGTPEGKALLDVYSSATGASGKRSPPYMGSASFYLLAGHEVATSLVRMIGDEKPEVPIR